MAAAAAAAGAGGPRGAAPSLRARLRAARVLLILTCIPHTVPFATRANLFRSLAGNDSEGFHATGIRVRRTHIVEDAFKEFEKIVHRRAPDALLRKLRVTFISADVRAFGGFFLLPFPCPCACALLAPTLPHSLTHTHLFTHIHPPPLAGPGRGGH